MGQRVPGRSPRARARRGGTRAALRGWPVVFALIASGFATAAAEAEGVQPRGATGDSLPVIERLLDARCSAPRPGGTVVDVAVIHFSSNVVADPTDPFRVDQVLALFERHRVSAHYLIARDGQVYRLVDESRRAFHAGRGRFPYAPTRDDRLNDTSIGIELLAVGSARDMRPFLGPKAYARIAARHVGFTTRQYESLRRLLADLHARYPALILDRKHVIGHEEYAPGRKTDPGELFRWELVGLKP